jgi:glycosyltransferase involved in cell wall biosynthesis
VSDGCRRLLMLVRSLDRGGAERQVVLLASGLPGLGWEPTVAVMYAGGALGGELAEAGVPLLDLRKKGRWDVAGFAFRLARAARQLRPDVVYGILPAQNLLALALRAVCPRVRVVWGVRGSARDLRRHDRLYRFVTWAQARLARFADLVVVNSEAGRAHVVTTGVPIGKTTVVSNGIDTAVFRPVPAMGDRVRQEWGVPSGEALVAQVGRLEAIKGQRTFLAAAAQVAPSRPGARFACVGDGPAAEREALRRLGEDLGLDGRVTWAGVRSDMVAVHNAADVVVSASDSEGFSNAIAEAMACGTPCVVTDVGDSALIVGDTGTVVPPHDPAALAEAVLEVLDRVAVDPEGVAARCRRRVEDRFGRQAALKLTADTLDRLCVD